MSRAALAAMLILTLAGAVPARADNDDPQTRLRAALKTATMRIRELEDQNAQLTAKQAAAERDRLDFTQKAAAADKELSELRQQGAADKTALDQASATQKQQGDSIAKWQASYNQAAEAARTRDGDAKRLDAVVGKLRPQVQSCEAKNAELYRIGEEVLGLYDKKGQLIHVGQAGSGFDQKSLKEIWGILGKLETKKNPFFGEVEALRKVFWVKPELVAEIEYTDWTEGTNAGSGPKLRAPVFLGLRDDKEPKECVWEEEVPST